MVGYAVERVDLVRHMHLSACANVRGDVCGDRARSYARAMGVLGVLLLGGVLGAGEPDRVARRDLHVVLGNAVRYVRTQQNPQGGFGAVQPHLQTSLALLAMLSVTGEPPVADLDRIDRAVSYLVRMGARGGDLGDVVFRVESHALATTALLCAIRHLRDPERRRKASGTVRRAMRVTQRWQDRSRSSPARGGWKMEGRKGTENDRRASTWALVSYHTARQYGLAIKSAAVDRGVHFLLGSFKKTAPKPDQVGGLSVDTQGLAVASISAMGGWALQRLTRDRSMARKNIDWLVMHPAVWSGPNYFYTSFFRVRTLAFADPTGEHLARCLRRLFHQIRDHQQPDGSITFPPGNAQNTVTMGPVFSTSLAVLILNVENSRLVFDEDYRVRPLF